MSTERFLNAGDVHRSSFSTQDRTPLYIGSGLAGGCIDGYGWMHGDFFTGESSEHNRALHFRTQGHFYRGEHGVDMMTALYHVGYKEKPSVKETGYSQTLHLHTATVETAYVTEDGTTVRIRAFCSIIKFKS